MSQADGGQRRFTRPIELGALEVAKRKAASQLSVFVAGPFIDKAWTDGERAAASPGARLRLEIVSRIEQHEHVVVLGEHEGVAEVTGNHIPSTANVVLSELQLVESADAVILIPDSLGSFCELGSWVMRDDFPPKTLILGNRTFEQIFGYVGHGVFLMAASMNARVEWVSYDNVEKIDEIVADFISHIQDRVISRSLRRGS